MSFKLLTLNTWNTQGPWKHRWELVFNEIKRRKPDAVAFQEVFDPDWAQMVSSRSQLPHLIFPNDGSGLMSISRYPVRCWKSVKFKTLSPNEEYPRCVLLVELETPGGQRMIANTHLTWRLDEGKIRQGQVQEMLDIFQTRYADDDILAVGDFNAHEDAPEIQHMIQSGGFTDLFRFLHPGVPGLTWDNRNPYTASHGLPDRRLDYIFFRNATGPVEEEISVEILFEKPDSAGVYASDHLGLFAVIGQKGAGKV